MNHEIIFLNEILKTNNAVGIIKAHKLEGVYFQYLTSKQNTQFQEQYKLQWIHNTVLMQTLGELGLQLKNLSSPVVILKGMHLLHEIYHDTGTRFMSDVDLLVDQNDLPMVDEILKQNNFTELMTRKFYGNNFKKNYSKKIDEIEVNIEIHSKLFFHHDFNPITTEVSKLEHFRQLSPEDLFIHLAGHLVLQHNFLFLYWLVDLYFLYDKNKKQMDWNYIHQMAKKRKLEKSVNLVLFVLEKYFKTERCDKLKFRFIYSWLINKKFLLRPSKHRIRYYLLKHLTKDHFSEALAYDWYWLKHKIC